LSNIKIFYRGGAPGAGGLEPAELKATIRALDVWRIPRVRFFIRHAQGIELDNVAVAYLQEDLRPPFQSMMSGRGLLHIKAQHAANVATFVLKNVEHFSARQCRGLPDTQLDQVDRKSF